MTDEVKITSEVEGQQHREEHYKEGVQDNLKEAVASEKKKVGKDKSKQKVNFPIRSLFLSRFLIFQVAETLKKVAKSEEVVSKVEEEEEVEEKDIDLFSESAMYNAYGICHNVQVE